MPRARCASSPAPTRSPWAANFDNLQKVPESNSGARITRLSAKRMQEAAAAVSFAVGLDFRVMMEPVRLRLRLPRPARRIPLVGCAVVLLAIVRVSVGQAEQNPAVPRASAAHGISPHFFGVNIENSYSNPVPSWS